MTEFHRKSGVEILVSPLMSLYWFFDATTVTQHNTVVPVLRGTITKNEAFRLAHQHLASQGMPRPRRYLTY